VFQQQPFIKALVLSIKRLLKCHPWHPGGFDYPPGSLPEHDKDQSIS
jgi:putative component of membrane protein insertase Oxa1/YidC/SpoIIIJ protein YidD